MINRKYLYIAIGIIGVGIVLLLLIFIPRIGKIPVTIYSLPVDAHITVDDKRSSTGEQYLSPGSYTFKATKKGWSSDTLEIEVSEDNSEVALILEPESDEARSESENTNNTDIREQLSSIRANSRGKTVNAKYPVLAKLPYSDTTGPYKIDYGFLKEDAATPYILISYSTPNGRIEALQWLVEQKVDITETEIIFSDFENPINEIGDFHG